MENQPVLCKHCTRCFNSPRGLRSHMKMHKKKQLSGGGGVLTTEMMALVEQPLALQMRYPSSARHYEAESRRRRGQASQQQRREYVCVDCNLSFKSHYALGGHRSSKHSLKRLQRQALLVHVDAQPLRLQKKAIVPSSSARHYEAEGRRRRGQGSQQQRREYVCVDCNLSFQSHYALGGHRSSKHSLKRLQRQALLLPPAAPNNNNNQVGLLRRSQRLRLFGVDLDVVPAASSS